jgi:hypothetical protein
VLCAVDYLVTTADEAMGAGTTKTRAATEKGVPLVAEQFVHDCIEKGKLLDPKDYGFNADGGDAGGGGDDDGEVSMVCDVGASCV